jgi:hypothetical protein
VCDVRRLISANRLQRLLDPQRAAPGYAALDLCVAACLQLALSWNPLFRAERSFEARFEGSDYSHTRKQHRPAIFGGINQHLNGKPPFLAVTF